MTLSSDEGYTGMPTSGDETTDHGMPSIPAVGMIWGIVDSERRRFDRHERWVGEKFDSLDTKLDRLSTGQDQIKELLAMQAGAKSAWVTLSKPMFAVLVAAISGLVSIGLHFYFRVTS